MAELATVLRMDTRRTAVALAVPALAVLGVAGACRSLVPGVASWDNTVVAAGAAVRLMGPPAAAFAAWTGVRERRLDHVRTLSARSPALGPVFDLVLLTTAVLVAYGVVVAVVVTWTVFEPRPAGLLAGAAALTLHVVAGYLAGRVLPSPLTVVGAGLLTWLWANERPPGWPALLPPAAIGPIGPFSVLRPGLAADQALWAAGVGTVLVVAYVWTCSRRWILLAPLLAGLAVSGVCTIRLQAYGGLAVTALDPQGRACRDWPLTVCVHPALRAGLPALESALTPLATRLVGTPGAFTRVEQLPGTAKADVRAGTAWIHLADLAPGYPARAVRELAGVLQEPCAVSNRPYGEVVTRWLLDVPRDAEGGAAARRFASWDEARRRGWLRAHYGRFHRCALGPGDFLPVRKPAKSVKSVKK